MADSVASDLRSLVVPAVRRPSISPPHWQPGWPDDPAARSVLVTGLDRRFREAVAVTYLAGILFDDDPAVADEIQESGPQVLTVQTMSDTVEVGLGYQKG